MCNRSTRLSTEISRIKKVTIKSEICGIVINCWHAANTKRIPILDNLKALLFNYIFYIVDIKFLFHLIVGQYKNIFIK